MAVDDTSGAGFDHRPIKPFVIHHLRRSGTAFDQLRPVSGFHLKWNMLRQPVDAPACWEMDAPVNAVLKRVPIPAELKINQLQPVVIDQTIIGTRVAMEICKEESRLSQVFGYDTQLLINSQSWLDSNKLTHVAEQCSNPFAPVIRRHAFARPQAAADTLELSLLAHCERVHSALCRCEGDQHGLGVSRIIAK